MGFAQGLDAGSRVARGWIDTYRSAQEVAEDREYKAKRKSIMDAQPEEGTSFTPEQGQRLAGLDPSRYSIGHDGSAYTVSDNENPQATQVIAPSSQYKFLGNQSASAYSPQQIDQMRGRALADLEAVRDPTKGLNLRAAVDARYQAEKKIADEEALKVKTADFYRNMAGMQTRDLVQYTNELLGDGALGDIRYDPQTGQLQLTSRVDGIPSGTVSRGDVMNVLGQAFTAGNGDARSGLPMMMKQMDELHKRQEGAHKVQADLAVRGAQVDNYRNMGDNRDANTLINQQRVDDQREYQEGSLEIQGFNAGSQHAARERGLELNSDRTGAYVEAQRAIAAERRAKTGTTKIALSPAENAELKLLEKRAQEEGWTVDRLRAEVGAVEGRAQRRHYVDSQVLPALKADLASGKVTAEAAVQALIKRGFSSEETLRIMQQAGAKVTPAQRKDK